jgi:hypothetical protein
MGGKIFISYRRHDSKYQARMIYNAFRAVLPPNDLFMDIDTIPVGADFVEVLEQWVGQSETMLALIGPGWVDAIDPKTGRRRLENPNDFVRVEVGAALKRGIPVVPVLLDGTPVPDPDELPEDLKNLARRQAEFVEFRTFDADVGRLIGKLGLREGSLTQTAREQTPAAAEKMRAEGQADRQRRETEAKYRAAEEPQQKTTEQEHGAEIEQRRKQAAEAKHREDEEAQQRRKEAAEAGRRAEEDVRKRTAEEEQRQHEAEAKQRRTETAEAKRGEEEKEHYTRDAERERKVGPEGRAEDERIPKKANQARSGAGVSRTTVSKGKETAAHFGKKAMTIAIACTLIVAVFFYFVFEPLCFDAVCGTTWTFRQNGEFLISFAPFHTVKSSATFGTYSISGNSISFQLDRFPGTYIGQINAVGDVMNGTVEGVTDVSAWNAIKQSN